MTSKAPSGRPTSGGNVPPTTRRSARQQRLANREANRALSRAGTGGSGGAGGPLMKYTIAALVIAAVVIGSVYWWTSQPKAKPALFPPNAPVGSAITPASIATNGTTLGAADAKHTIDLYEDYQCPVCRDFTANTEPLLVGNYVIGGRAKMVFHDYIVIDKLPTSIGTESLDAANAARCAADQGQFWLMHDWLFNNQYAEGSGAFTKDRLKSIGQAAGIKDINKFNSCVDSGTHNDEIKTETVPSGVTGTPTIAVDGVLLSGYDYATISAALDKALGVTPSPSVSASPSTGTSGSPVVSHSTYPSVKPS
jgi:protein-disulfide isomerase